jgi:hypothetical protein
MTNRPCLRFLAKLHFVIEKAAVQCRSENQPTLKLLIFPEAAPHPSPFRTLINNAQPDRGFHSQARCLVTVR